MTLIISKRTVSFVATNNKASFVPDGLVVGKIILPFLCYFIFLNKILEIAT